MDIRFDTYYTNDDLQARVTALAEVHPFLCELRTLGRTHEGRDIPLVVLTNRSTGEADEKPAFWIDANIHATELTGSMAALYVIRKLLDGHGWDPEIRRLLDEQAFYIVPRLNLDGAAAAQAARPKHLRSGTRPYPFAERRQGLHQEDVDGDGRILQMRIPDPSGDWKVHPQDPRRMVKRGIDEHGGSYYRLFVEGRAEAYDGVHVKAAPAFQGLDFNRNYPGGWRPEGQQKGAGDYPGSEPEIRAVIDFLSKRKNVFGGLTFHTFSRAILRPFGTKKDEDMDTHDLWVFQAIGERGTALTGYPCVSVYHDFKYHPKEVITGVFDEWLYEHHGVLALTVELWDLPTAAGCEAKNKDKKFIEWFRKHPPEDDDKIAAFIDEHAPDMLVPWRPFEHPQLGPVELGGWDRMWSFRNPPPQLLEKEIAPHADFVVAFASLAPRLAWRSVEAKALGGGSFHVRAVIENLGFLPSAGSCQAKTMKAVEPVRIEVGLAEGMTLAGGERRTELGHLEGRSNKMEVSSMWSSSDTDNRAKAEWLVDAPAGGALTLTAVGGRAGTIRRTVELVR